MRARNLKPGFFKNEDLAELDPITRILFAGLWCMADREGRLEYRPKRIKAELLPYDNVNIEKHLILLSKEFITIYEVDGNKYIEINKFKEHQNCHVKEQPSTIPAPYKTGASMEVAGPLSSFPLPITESPLPLTERGGKSAKIHTLKNKHLDSVLLTSDEYQKLQEAMGQKSLDIGIEKLDYSITVKDGKYKDHYKTLLNWFKRGYFDGTSNRSGNNGGTGKTTQKTGGARSDDEPYPVDVVCTE